jgi:DNA-binding transcriptional LysR family regulator
MDQFTIECFLAVANVKSFTKAAKQVNRTQSAVTQQINGLEKYLNVRLFDRSNGVVLTKEGDIFLPYAKKIFSLNQEVLDRFKQPEVEGEVYFGVPEDFATLFLSDVLSSFSLLHPRIFLSVECDFTLNLFNKFKKGQLDLVMVKMCSSEDIPRGVEVWQERLVWVGKKRSVIDKDLIETLPLIMSAQPCVYRSTAIEALEKNGYKWRMVYSSPSYAGIIAAVKADMGITALPLAMIPEGLQEVSHIDLPPLPDIHVSLLKQSQKKSESINTLESFLVEKLRYLRKRSERK